MCAVLYSSITCCVLQSLGRTVLAGVRCCTLILLLCTEPGSGAVGAGVVLVCGALLLNHYYVQSLGVVLYVLVCGALL